MNYPRRQYFGTDGIRGRVGSSIINPEFVLKLGWAVGKVLARSGNSKVILGKDTRVSGYMFEAALEAGLSAAGVDTHLLGPMPTPGVAYLTRTLRAQAGIVISASHNPYYDNGIKFFSAVGTKLPDDVECEIEKQLNKPLNTVDSSKIGKAYRIVDAAGRYIEFCKSTFPSHCSLQGLKIVIDCAHGATYHIAPSVFNELGADVVSLSVEPDGFNINANCGATDTALLRHTVLQQAADIGIAFDGDGDRVIMIDHQGNVLDGDTVLYIIAKYYHDTHKLTGGVVGTIMSNWGLERAFNLLGIPFVRAQVGDRYVVDTLRQKGWQLGGEKSGHILCLDLTSTGDGIVAALRVLAALRHYQCSLAQLHADFIQYPQVLQNIAVSSLADPLDNPRIVACLREVETQLKEQGRVLLRKSGTESMIRIMVEGSSEVQILQLANQLADVVRTEIS